jgi:hypothetical protein
MGLLNREVIRLRFTGVSLMPLVIPQFLDIKKEHLLFIHQLLDVALTLQTESLLQSI